MKGSSEAHGLATWIRRVAPLEWLCLVAGLVLVLHYAWFMDDAFVFFRYVDNLLFLGHGLVWNAGEYVEGFSSALWLLILVPLRATGMDWWLITRLLGLLIFGCFWVLLVSLNRRLSPPEAPRVNLPLCLLTFNYGVLCYFTSGLETPLVQLAAVACALYALRPESRGLQLFLGMTPLLRHELALACLLCIAWCWIRTRRLPRTMLVTLLVVPGGWMLFRVWYYADLFPNTFYLKDELDLAQGWVYLLDTARTYWLDVVLLLHLVALGWLVRGRARARDGSLEIAPRLLLALIALLFAAYVVKIGGDPRHYRYLAFPVCLIVCACGGVAEQLLAGRFTLRGRTLAGASLGLLAIATTASFHPRQLSAHPFFGKSEHSTVDKINDAAGHRHNPHLAQPPWGRGRDVDLREQYADFLASSATKPYTAVGAESNCVRMFRAFETRWVHSLGLTDPILSRTIAPADRPAHKLGLIPMSRHMRSAIERCGGAPYPGMYRELLEAGTAPPWVRKNLASIELVERKMFNRHDLFENILLAFSFPKRIDPEMRRVALPPGVQRPR